jgi:pimeloyl-ACP methyl ester carboxylesterase
MKKRTTANTRLGILGAALLGLAAYFFVLRPRLAWQTGYQIELLVLLGLLLALVGAFVFFLIRGVGIAWHTGQAGRIDSFQGSMMLLFSLILLLVFFLGVSQRLAHTPPILDPQGSPLPNSIAALEKVRLGGADQWLILRGHDTRKPVLLFLSGGPGASEAARVLRFNQELEQHFVVVIWEQRGCGKSYPSHYPSSRLTLAQYEADLIELADLLRERFDEQKIYLVGHSWGTIIGAQAAIARPDLFHAYVGTSQMVDVLETDQVIYEMVMDASRQAGDAQFVSTLEAQGPPPYAGLLPIRPYAALFGREYTLFEYPMIQSEEYRREGDILMLMLKQPEYGWLDRIYYLLGLVNTFNVVYPQLQDLDYRRDAARFELPVYLILGRHDMNNPAQIPEEYYNLLEAPRKQLYFFENSGHGMIWEEPSLFLDILVNTVLAETYPR